MLLQADEVNTDAVQRIAAFCDGEKGGNPAGVLLAPSLPTSREMQEIAKAVGYSETAFAAPEGAAWRVRYFAPEMEVPFCGHATIALGAALRGQFGKGRYALHLNTDQIEVEAEEDMVSLVSPSTASKPLTPENISSILNLFGYTHADLDGRLNPAWIYGGAQHAVIALKSRELLARMQYDLKKGAALMAQLKLVTIAFVVIENDQRFWIRNAFAAGGVIEDPATGAAAAAFSGYLRDIHWPHGGEITLYQGQDMGMPSVIHTEIPPQNGAGIRVKGRTRFIHI